MSGIQHDISDADLHAYVDGMLDSAARVRVEAYLAQMPERAAEVEAWQQQNAALRALYGPAAQADIPARLNVKRMETIRREKNAGWRRMAAAAVLFLAVGVGAGWFGRGLTQMQQVSMIDQAIEAHQVYTVEKLHPVEVWADQAPHLRAWLSKRLDRPLTLPDLGEERQTLVGGRLLSGPAGPTALIMYEDQAGQRMTLYIVPDTEGGQSAFHHARTQNLDTYSWRDAGLAYVLVGALPRDKMEDIAARAYDQLGAI